MAYGVGREWWIERRFTAILNHEGAVETEAVKRERRRWTCGCLAAFLLLLLILVAPLIVLFGGTLVSGLRLETTMTRYPGSEQVFSMSQYHGYSSNQITVFYRTQDDVETVKAFYEDFTLPFVGNTTLFQPYGEVLELGTEAYTFILDMNNFGNTEEGQWLERRQCHWSQKFTCVQIDIVEYPPLELPEYIWRYDKIEPVLPDELGTDDATLILYSFFIEADAGINLWSE